MEAVRLCLRPGAWSRVFMLVICLGTFLVAQAQQPSASGVPELRFARVGNAGGTHAALLDGSSRSTRESPARTNENQPPVTPGAIELQKVFGAEIRRKHASLYWGLPKTRLEATRARTAMLASTAAQLPPSPVAHEPNAFVAEASGSHAALYKGSATPISTSVRVPVPAPAPAPAPAPGESQWHYGAFVDVGYLLDFNHPANNLFRSSGTTWNVDRVRLNMAQVYLRKLVSEGSRWGVELTAHAGKDSQLLGTSPTAPNIGGFKFLRQLGPTNVSYLAPFGHGLTFQAGIFTGLIGYDSLYSKDGFAYTRSWGAAITPFLMMGVNASYPFNKKLTGTFFVINGYAHLAHANNVPSSGGQLAYAASPHWTLKETVLVGPHQRNTAARYWRSLSDTIVERKGREFTFAFEYIVATEKVNAPGDPRALVMTGQFPVHWAFNRHWSATVRPEMLWDRDGRWTLARQTIRAVTTTLEYRVAYEYGSVIFRLEHRYDDSHGPDGGFYRGATLPSGVVALTSTQNLLVFGLLFTFDH